MRDDRARLVDIREAIERIKRYAARGRTAFEQDELIQVWIVHHLQVIGEACFAMSATFKAAHPQIPWTQIVGMRHILVHQYFGVDQDIVWSAVEQDLPALEAQVMALLASPPAP
jgi:uncharacterized protein with HEPN domain